MATLNEIAYNIKNLISGGVASDDSDVSLRQIKFMVHYHRANLLIQYTDNGKKASNSIFQVEAVSPSASGITLGLVGFNDNRAIRSIAYKDDTSVDSSYVPLPIVQNHDRMFINNSRFILKANSKIATLSDRKLYVWEGESIVSDGALEINGVFSDPTTVSSYTSDEVTEYPIPEELIPLLVQNVLQLEFNVMLSNNAKTPNNQVDENAQSKEPGV
jgi:hypothetical protein|tara:strand:+ start:9769 stop:10416 length:648 start_codon:yes stop_codon:yes gene_type:complete